MGALHLLVQCRNDEQLETLLLHIGDKYPSMEALWTGAHGVAVAGIDFRERLQLPTDTCYNTYAEGLSIPKMTEIMSWLVNRDVEVQVLHQMILSLRIVSFWLVRLDVSD
ncbi:hypothetical protein HPP92_029137 [Vanilla planifolia]|uniref:Uncharacterized protein n=1 Tax=Vanilla planifolia TaxID=51239 RepID=A0A835P3F6_VANPL|nr:hypothetical protein HPP92_029137 [Vanilla planifolia]KAG0445856.1 hypothetical protein HPP92_029126 [Vanilla planifolia]